MRKVILNLAVSLDGFICREDGLVDFLDDLDMGDSDGGFTAFMASIDALIMGSSSYETTLKLGNGLWPFKEQKTYVFSRRDILVDPSVILVNNNVEEFVQSLTKEEGKKIWLFGGSKFVHTLREANLVDEYMITYIPKMIGKGIPLFNNTDKENELEIIDTIRSNNVMTIHYKVIK